MVNFLWCHFFNFFDLLFGEGLISSLVLLSLEDLLRLWGLFLLRSSFRGSPTCGRALFVPLSLVIIWPHKGRVLLSITRTAFITRHNAWLVFWNWRGFYVLFNFVVVLWWQKVIADFKLHIELWRSAFDSNKDCKRMGDWAPVWYRLGSTNAVLDYLRFYEIKLLSLDDLFC